MKKRKLISALGALTAAAVSVCAVSVTSWAALVEGSSDNVVAYEVLPDPYIDYTEVNAIEAVVTANGGYANGCIGVTALDGEWLSSYGELYDTTAVWRIDGLSGIFAPENGDPAIYVQFWIVEEGVTYTVDSLTLYDADGNVITPGDTIVDRPDVRFPDAEPLNIDNDSFSYPGQIDIAKAVGEDFGSIGKIEATFKWGTEGYWNGCVDISGVTRADGSVVAWDRGLPEIGNVNDNAYLADAREATFTVFDFGDNPLTELYYVGATGEIAGYGVLDFGFWGQDGEIPPEPAVSNITFYDEDGNVVASLDYETRYDIPEDSEEPAEPAEPDEPAEPAPSTDDTSVSDDTKTEPDKGSPDTGVSGIAAAVGAAVIACGAVIISKKRK